MKRKGFVLIISTCIAGLLLIVASVILFCTSFKIEQNKTVNVSVEDCTINNIVEIDDIYLNVIKYGFTTSNFSGIYLSNKNNMFCVIDIIIYNQTADLINLHDKKFSYCLIYDNIYKYDDIYKDTDVFLVHYKEVMPLEKIEACVCFEVPVTVYENNKKELKFDLIKGKKIYRWILREEKTK